MDLDLIRLILAGIFLCVGTVGNILAVISVTNKYCKKSSYTVYIAALAITDLLALYTLVISSRHLETLGINLTATSPLYCKLHLFLTGLFSGVSIWLIVVLALERTFVVYFPFKAKSACKPRNAFITTASLVICFTAYSSHYLYGMQIQSGIRANGDLLKPSFDSNASTNFGRNENASLPPFTEAVSHSLNKDNINNDNDDNNNDDDYYDYENGSTIEELLGRFYRTEITTSRPAVTVIGPGRDTTDHPLTIAENSTDTTTEIRLPVMCNSGHLGDLSRAIVCNSSDLKSIGPWPDSLPFNNCNSSDLRNDGTTPMLPNLPKDNCTTNTRMGENSQVNDSHVLKDTKPRLTPRNQDNDILITSFCGFVDESYANFYRSWATSIEHIFYFLLPLLILITANTITVKVYRSSRTNLSSSDALALRRTRHVLIMTSLISMGFIVFITPISVIYVLEALLADDYRYPLYNGEYRPVLQLIGECLYLCNHSLNFFLYIISGKRFRNSLKAAFCKPESQM